MSQRSVTVHTVMSGGHADQALMAEHQAHPLSCISGGGDHPHETDERPREPGLSEGHTQQGLNPVSMTPEPIS